MIKRLGWWLFWLRVKRTVNLLGLVKAKDNVWTQREWQALTDAEIVLADVPLGWG